MKYFTIEQKTLDKYFNYQISQPAFGCEPEYSCRVLFCFSSLLLPFCIKMEQKFAKQGKSAKKHEKQYLASRCGARDPFIGRNIQKEAHIEKS